MANYITTEYLHDPTGPEPLAHLDILNEVQDYLTTTWTVQGRSIPLQDLAQITIIG